MSKLTFMVMRRMRMPLLILLASYVIALLGMTLVPGVDANGAPWRMDFFHAYYFISYMATTIGFGEIPYEFSDAQRAWVTVSLYLTVIAWFYAIGAILNILQDTAFRRAIIQNRFARTVSRLREPFYLVCGFGDTGKALIRALTDRSIRVVTMDINEDDINFLALQNFLVDVPGLCGDASHPNNLIKGGVLSPYCQGVVALTHKEPVNLKVAISSKLLAPALPVICRGETKLHKDNMASFGTDHIIDPFITFADRLALALEKPGAFLLYNWLTAVPDSPMPDVLLPPDGLWILCGFGRFGKAMHDRLVRLGMRVVTIEPHLDPVLCPSENIVGWGTDAQTLLSAGIEQAVGLVAGTENDTNNLSIVMTAQELNPDLFVVIRQNRSFNRALFQAIRADIVMEPSDIVAQEVRVLLTFPLLMTFLDAVVGQDNAWANQVASRLIGMAGEMLPEVWCVTIDATHATAVCPLLARGDAIAIQHLMRNPRHRQETLSALALLLQREKKIVLMPEMNTVLKPGDELLFCGQHGAADAMRWTLQNQKVLRYVLSGCELPEGMVWRWLVRRRGQGEEL